MNGGLAPKMEGTRSIEFTKRSRNEVNYMFLSKRISCCEKRRQSALISYQKADA